MWGRWVVSVLWLPYEFSFHYRLLYSDISLGYCSNLWTTAAGYSHNLTDEHSACETKSAWRFANYFGRLYYRKRSDATVCRCSMTFSMYILSSYGDLTDSYNIISIHAQITLSCDFGVLLTFICGVSF